MNQTSRLLSRLFVSSVAFAAAASILPACQTLTVPAKSAQKKVLRGKRALNPEIQTELATLGELPAEAPAVTPVTTPAPAPATTPTATAPAAPAPIASVAPQAPDAAGIGRKISGGGNASDVSVKIQELADGELLITPTALAGKAKPQTKLVEPTVGAIASEPLKQLKSLESSNIELSSPTETPLIFDIPVTYNDRVRVWVRYFQGEGRTTFRNWLERSSRYLPILQYELQQAGLPQDLVYVAMIESGFVSHAASHAGAKGMWQFIVPTARRYNLRVDTWIDERQDFHKSTIAAIRYMSDLYKQFNSWYLVSASYNMGENGVRRLIQRWGTNNFWDLAERGVLPQETTDYVPKIIAAMLISKAPALYGFRDLNYQMPLSFEQVSVPGGTDIIHLAGYLGVSEKYLKDLNPELIKGVIPHSVRSHKIRVPKGSMLAVSQFVRLQASN